MQSTSEEIQLGKRTRHAASSAECSEGTARSPAEAMATELNDNVELHAPVCRELVSLIECLCLLTAQRFSDS